MTSAETARPETVELVSSTLLKYLRVLQVGCNPLSDQDELHLNVLEKHVSSSPSVSALVTNVKKKCLGICS